MIAFLSGAGAEFSVGVCGDSLFGADAAECVGAFVCEWVCGGRGDLGGVGAVGVVLDGGGDGGGLGGGGFEYGGGIVV